MGFPYRSNRSPNHAVFDIVFCHECPFSYFFLIVSWIKHELVSLNICEENLSTNKLSLCRMYQNYSIPEDGCLPSWSPKLLPALTLSYLTLLKNHASVLCKEKKKVHSGSLLLKNRFTLNKKIWLFKLATFYAQSMYLFPFRNTLAFRDQET